MINLHSIPNEKRINKYHFNYGINYAEFVGNITTLAHQFEAVGITATQVDEQLRAIETLRLRERERRLLFRMRDRLPRIRIADGL